MYFYDWITFYIKLLVFVLFCFVSFDFVSFVCTGPSTAPGVQKYLNVHAPQDGTAAGRHGGAAREHLICS